MVLPHEDERLADWVDGRLGERERERLEAEFRVNPELEHAALDYRRFVERLREGLQHETETESASGDLTDRIMARVATSRGRHLRLVPWMGSLAAAAAIVLIYVAIRSLPDPEPESTPTASHAARPAEGVVERDEAARPKVGGGAGAPRDKLLRGGNAPGRENPPAPASRARPRSGLREPEGEVLDERKLGVLEEQREAGVDAREQARRADLESETITAYVEELEARESAPEPSEAVDLALASESVPVVVFELPAELVAAGRSAMRLAEPEPEEDQEAEKADRNVSRELWSLLGQQLVRTPMAQQRQRGEVEPPELRLGRARERVAADRDAIPEETAAAPSGVVSDPADEAAGYEVRPGDQLFELRGTREQVGAYLRRLAELGRQNRANVQIQRLAAGRREVLERYDFVELEDTEMLDAPAERGFAGQPRAAKKAGEAKTEDELSFEPARAEPPAERRVIVVVRRRDE